MIHADAHNGKSEMLKTTQFLAISGGNWIPTYFARFHYNVSTCGSLVDSSHDMLVASGLE